MQQFSTDYSAFLIALARPSAFPFPFPNDCAIPVIQTHASAVLRNLREAFNSEQEQHIQHLVITTTLPLMVNIEQILDALRLPRLMCPV